MAIFVTFAPFVPAASAPPAAATATPPHTSSRRATRRFRIPLLLRSSFAPSRPIAAWYGAACKLSTLDGRDDTPIVRGVQTAPTTSLDDLTGGVAGAPKLENLPLWERVHAHLRDEILAHRLPPGAEL